MFIKKLYAKVCLYKTQVSIRLIEFVEEPHYKSNPFTCLYRSWGLQEVETTRFRDNRYIKGATLSALGTGRLYHQGNILGSQFC